MGHGLCAACYMFARDHAVDACTGCGRRQPVRRQYCRLCWCQARTLSREVKTRAGTTAVDYLHQVRYHQLFFADMLSTRGCGHEPAAHSRSAG